MQVAELDRRFAEIPSASTPTGIQSRPTEWYLDRLGKLERYRRQIYSLTLTRHTPQLWLGLLTVIEWPKDASEPHAPPNASAGTPRFERDTTQVCARIGTAKRCC